MGLSKSELVRNACFYIELVSVTYGLIYAICDMKYGVGEIIRGLIFLVCNCPSHFLSIDLSFYETEQLIIWVLSKSWSDCLGV